MPDKKCLLSTNTKPWLRCRTMTLLPVSHAPSGRTRLSAASDHWKSADNLRRYDGRTIDTEHVLNKDRKPWSVNPIFHVISGPWHHLTPKITRRKYTAGSKSRTPETHSRVGTKDFFNYSPLEALYHIMDDQVIIRLTKNLILAVF